MAEISLILPCYKTANYVARSFQEATEVLSTLSSSWEIIAVDDGSPDDGATWSVLQAAEAADARIRVLRHPKNRGKGSAIKTGLLASRGDYCIVTDAELPYQLDNLMAMVLFLQHSGGGMIIGDRLLPGSEYHASISLARAVLSKICSRIVGAFVVGGYFDTQCGLKGFRGSVGREIARLMRINGFACDVEMIYIALKNRIDIRRIPVMLRRNEPSSISAIRTSLVFAAQLVYLYVNRFRNRYISDTLSNFCIAEYHRQMELFNEQRKH